MNNKKPLNEKPAPEKFEDALRELESIVQNIENGAPTLEESIVSYKRGLTLLQVCQRQLAEAEQQISVLQNGVASDYSAAAENTMPPKTAS